MTQFCTSINNPPKEPEKYLAAKGGSGANWWRKYSDGFIEQNVRKGGSGYIGFINFPIAFATTSYAASITAYKTGSGASAYGATEYNLNARTVNGCYAYSQDGEGVNIYACGY